MLSFWDGTRISVAYGKLWPRWGASMLSCWEWGTATSHSPRHSPNRWWGTEKTREIVGERPELLALGWLLDRSRWDGGKSARVSFGLGISKILSCCQGLGPSIWNLFPLRGKEFCQSTTRNHPFVATPVLFFGKFLQHLFHDTLWWTNIAMENGHWNSGFSHEKLGGSFHGKMLVHQAGYSGRGCLNQLESPAIFQRKNAWPGWGNCTGPWDLRSAA